MSTAQTNFSALSIAPVSTAIAEIQSLVKIRDLKIEGVWRLHRTDAREFEERAGFRPDGGWRSLTALVVGTGVLRATEQGFTTGPRVDISFDEDEARRALVEAFSCYLMPPAVAAGMFLAVSIHPLWGLRLARFCHLNADHLESPSQPWKDEAMLPDEDLNRIASALKTLIRDFIDTLIDTPSTSLDVLEDSTAELVRSCRDSLASDNSDGLDVLVEVGNQKANDRSTAFFVREFVDNVLLPAGVAHLDQSQHLTVDHELLRTVTVGIPTE